MREWDHLNSRIVDHVTGAFLLMRRTIFQKLNGFDPAFFMYLEDVDLSLRAARLGLTSYYEADVQAFHRGGGTSSKVRADRLFYSLRSRSIYFAKHFSRGAIFLVTAAIFFEFLPRCVLGLTPQSSVTRITDTIRAYRMYLIWLIRNYSMK
jgi:hypothetical protein